MAALAVVPAVPVADTHMLAPVGAKQARVRRCAKRADGRQLRTDTQTFQVLSPVSERHGSPVSFRFYPQFPVSFDYLFLPWLDIPSLD